MSCYVMLEQSQFGWFWHCVSCVKKGPVVSNPIVAASESLDHRIEVAYADVNPLEGLME